MPINYQYDKEKDVLFVSVEDEVSLEDFDEFMKKIVRSTESPPDIRTLWVLRKVDFTLADSNRFITAFKSSIFLVKICSFPHLAT